MKKGEDAMASELPATSEILLPTDASKQILDTFLGQGWDTWGAGLGGSQASELMLQILIVFKLLDIFSSYRDLQLLHSGKRFHRSLRICTHKSVHLIQGLSVYGQPLLHHSPNHACHIPVLRQPCFPKCFKHIGITAGIFKERG